MNNHPLVSIGMPVFNCERTVADAIASILNQTFDDWELIVYDDGSHDGTLSVARQFLDARIRVIEGGRNRGLPSCLNQIIAQCGSEYFARMDGDDVAYPERLKCQLGFLQSHPEVDLVGGSMVIFRNDGTAYGTRLGPLTHEQICARPWNGFPIGHPTWMGRSEWFRRNEYCVDAVLTQDQVLLLRTYHESRFANVPEVVLGYREDSLSLRKLLATRMNMGRMMFHPSLKMQSVTSGILGLFALIAKSLFDTLAVFTRLEYKLLRHRGGAIGTEQKARWKSVWEEARATSNRFLPDRRYLQNDSQAQLCRDS